jgi:histidine phosphotransferase ChpT
MDGWTGRLGEGPRLAELVAARICHDLGSPVATLGALLPQAAEPEALQVLVDAGAELRGRLRLFAALFGPCDPLGWPEVAALLAASPVAQRVRFALPAAGGEMPGGLARLCLAAALLAAEALPRGGVVQVTATAPRGLAFRAEGRQVEWSPVLLDLLAGGPLDAALAQGPRRVLAPWLLALAAGEAQEVGFALAAEEGPPALLLTPRG